MMFVDRLDVQDPRVAPRTMGVPLAQLPEELVHVRKGREEDLLGARARGVAILLAQRDEFLGQALGFLGFVPCCLDGFVGDEGGDQVAEKGLPVGAVPGEVSVLDGAAGHV